MKKTLKLMKTSKVLYFIFFVLIQLIFLSSYAICADIIPPAPIYSLLAPHQTEDSITLIWTTVGDDWHEGTAASYDIRYSTEMITEANWDFATQVIDEPTPQIASSQDSYTVIGLIPDTIYYFAIKVEDEALNWSDLSIIALNKTGDNQPPSCVGNLTATAGTTPNIELNWESASDNEGIDHYNIYRVTGNTDIFKDSFDDGVLDTSKWFTHAGGYGISITEDLTSKKLLMSGVSTGPSGDRINFISTYNDGNLKKLTFSTYIDVSASNNTNGDVAGGMFPVSHLTGPLIPIIGIRKAPDGTCDVGSAEHTFQPWGTTDGDCKGTVKIEFELQDCPDNWKIRISWEDNILKESSYPGSISSKVALVLSTLAYSAGDEVNVKFGDALIMGTGRELIGPTSNLTYTDTPGILGETYCYQVSAVDLTQNEGPAVKIACAVAGGETQPPSCVGDLTATAGTSPDINLSWLSATDNIEVDHYNVYKVGSGTKTLFEDNFDDNDRDTNKWQNPMIGPAINIEEKDMQVVMSGVTSENDGDIGLLSLPLIDSNISPITITVHIDVSESANSNGDVAGVIGLANPSVGALMPGIGIRRTPSGTYDIGSAEHTFIPWITVPSASGTIKFELENATNLPVSRFRIYWNDVPLREGPLPFPFPSPLILGLGVSTYAAGDNVNVKFDDVLVTGPDDLITNNELIKETKDLLYTDSTGIPGQTYCYVVKAVDTSDNEGPSCKTACATVLPPDTTPPVSSVSPLPPNQNNLTFDISWSGTDGLSGIKNYTIYVSDNGVLPYEALLTNTTLTSYSFTGVSGHTYKFYSIATDNAGNVESAPTEPDAITTIGDIQPPSAITDLYTSNPTENSITLNWTAVGDDGNAGTASQYDIRYSTNPISDTSSESEKNNWWNNATVVTNPPIPGLAGSIESFNVTGLTIDTKYYFAVKVADEVPNWSDLSNIVSETTVYIDLGISKWGTGPRPGVEESYYISYYNSGSKSADNVQIIDTLPDPSKVEFISSEPLPYTYDSGPPQKVTYNVGTLDSGSYRNIQIIYKVLAPLNDELINTVTIAPTDDNPGNNTYTLTQTVVGSWDPNDKGVAPQGFAPEGYITGNQPLWYIIHYENIGNAPAVNIRISDTLNSNLDENTLSTISDNGAYDPNTRTINWDFQNINLPPEGEGAVTFRVSPQSGLTSGTQIQNYAVITFNGNPPMDTPSVINTIDNTPPMSSVSSLQQYQYNTNFEVSWSGTDEHSGIKDYIIYVSDNGGPYNAWLNNTNSTSAMFSGENGHTYRF